MLMDLMDPSVVLMESVLANPMLSEKSVFLVRPDTRLFLIAMNATQSILDIPIVPLVTVVRMEAKV